MSQRKLLFLSILLMLSSSIIMAGGKSLSLKKSIPEAGTVNVTVDTVIILEFSNNVVNLNIQSINKLCFNLENREGENIPIEVIFPDDQLEPEKKRIISLKPVGALEKSMDYILLIDGGLQSKNGQILGKDIVVNFTTGN